MLLVANSNVRHRHPKRGSKKTGLTDSLRNTQFAAVLNHSELVRVRKRDFVSLTYKRLRLHSRRGCSDSKASN